MNGRSRPPKRPALQDLLARHPDVQVLLVAEGRMVPGRLIDKLRALPDRERQIEAPIIDGGTVHATKPAGQGAKALALVSRVQHPASTG